MKIRPECVPCLMDRVLFQAKLANNGSEFKALKKAMETYSKEFADGRNSAAVATEVHRSAYEAMGIEDPYREIKMRSDSVASEYLDIAGDFIEGSADRFRASLLVSIIGNIMDFGASNALKHPDQLRAEFGKMLEQEVIVNDMEGLRQAVENAGTIIFIFDNCGEARFDTFLIRILRQAGSRVVGVVRGQPILNDITMEDAIAIGLQNEVDRLLTTSQFAIGMDLREIDEDLSEEISRADIIIAKGMANFESLSDQDIGPMVYLLRTKCVPVAEEIGEELNTNVARFVKRT